MSLHAGSIASAQLRIACRQVQSYMRPLKPALPLAVLEPINVNTNKHDHSVVLRILCGVPMYICFRWQQISVLVLQVPLAATFNKLLDSCNGSNFCLHNNAVRDLLPLQGQQRRVRLDPCPQLLPKNWLLHLNSLSCYKHQTAMDLMHLLSVMYCMLYIYII